MSIEISNGFPCQQLSYKQKGYKWRKQCVDYADSKGSEMFFSPVRKTVRHKRINYDLVNMKLHMDDIRYVLNPNNLKANFLPETIQHYPIINAKLELLRGECISREFPWNVVVTNPNMVSEIENAKRDAIHQSLQNLIQSSAVSEEDFQKKLEEQNDYFTYHYKDFRVMRATELLKHYVKQYDLKDMFDTQGIMDAMIVKEEAYLNDVIGGEPVVEKLDPLNLRVFRSGNSNKMEDADMIVYESYKSIGWVYDTYHDVLKPKDIKYLENIISSSSGPGSDEWDERNAYITDYDYGDNLVQNPHFFSSLLGDGYGTTMLPYDGQGNVRVLRVYWKSRRKIKKIKSYDPQTGEEEFHFYPETYVVDPTRGEEEEVFWVNEAWEGTKIGTDIYVNMRPKPVQYASMSNPSACHFGIIGQIYNIGSSNSPSLVDKMKPYAYLYDAVYDKLYKLLEANLGKLTIFDTAGIPDTWTVEKWLYYAKVNHLAVKDSFNEGKKGAATGKLYAGLNTASNGVVDASVGQEIQYNLQLLELIDQQMGKAVGISPQREGQIANRETVGGVERATLQSSHITESLFAQHDSLKKREMECLLETAKAAMRGRKKKFEYITSDGSRKIMEIDGDEFAECDYGIVVDSTPATQMLHQKIEMLAQAGMQNQLIDFSSMMRLYTSDSLAEKIRMIEACEKRMRDQQQQQLEMQRQMQEEQLRAAAEQEQAKREQENLFNERDNNTKVLVAQIQAQANIDASVARASGFTDTPAQPLSEKDRLELKRKQQEFEEKNKMEQKKLELEREKLRSQERIAKQKASSTPKK